eukprot:5802076-Pleurochrysis_carterae.AAC.1
MHVQAVQAHTHTYQHVQPHTLPPTPPPQTHTRRQADRHVPLVALGRLEQRRWAYARPACPMALRLTAYACRRACAALHSSARRNERMRALRRWTRV